MENKDISDAAKKSQSILKNLIVDYEEIIGNTINGDIPESIFDFVTRCSVELSILKSELGVEHRIHVESANRIVNLTGTLMSIWIKENSSLLFTPISGMRLGDNFYQVCNRVFNEISKVEMAKSTRAWLDNLISNFNIH